MATKAFPTQYAHGTITLTASVLGDDGSTNVFFQISDIINLGCASFNGRSGAVTLTTADITNAGGAAAANPNITGTETHGSAGAVKIMGAASTASTVLQKFRTGGFGNDYDVEFAISGGTNSVNGLGTINFVCGTFQINGTPIGASSNPTPRIVTASGPAQVLSTDGLLVINKSASEATTVTLEASPAANRVPVRIVDGKGDAGTNNITIVPASGTIDGTSTFVINQNRGAATVEFAGGNWYVT